MKNLQQEEMKGPRDLQWTLHQARQRLTPSIELRKKFREASYHGQLQAEKVNIMGHIDRLQPGIRRVYLEKRLQWLNKKSP